MDYRALGELIWFSFLGLSVLTVVMGISVRLFLAPVVREVLERLRGDADHHQRLTDVRVERTEERLGEVETLLHRLSAAEAFHRELRAGGADDTDTDDADASHADAGRDVDA